MESSLIDRGGPLALGSAGASASGDDLVRLVMELVRGRLPSGWTADVETPADRRDYGVDGILRLRAPDGQEAVLLVEAKRLLNTRDVPAGLRQLQAAASRWDQKDATVVPLLAARYLAPSTRERIAEAGAGYVDATGNMRVTVDRPALFIADRGADRDPWRGPGRPRGSLKGPPAARVVRALVDFAPPYTVPELSERAGASTGATYRAVEFLEQEGLVERQRYGPIREVRWRNLLERWSEDYGFASSNTVATYLEPRGLAALTHRLASLPDLDYVVTGSLAADRVAAYAPARLATLYVRDLPAAAEALELRRTDVGANVALATGAYDVVFDRSETIDGLRVAALSQVAVDLLTGPGRNPGEATALLDWMEADESRWRR
jgi:hypothetical protein